VRRTFAIVLLAAVRATAAPLPLAAALRRVEERGPDQAVAGAQVDVARAEVTTARMLPNPTIAFNAGRAEPVFAASVAQRLPLFGQRGAAIRAAEGGVTQARAEADLLRWRLRHDGRVAYYAAVRADDEVQIAAEIEALTRRIADMARQRFEAGAGTRLEREQGSLVHVRAVQAVSDRQAEARVARLELARLLGGAPDESHELTDALAVEGAMPPVEELLSDARSRHPELRALAAEREAALLRASAARAERRPTPTLELGVEVLDAATCGNGSDRCVGPRGALSFELPVLNLNAGPIARAEAEAQLATTRYRVAAWRVETLVRAAWQRWSAARARARFFDETYLPSAISVEAMAREAFATGRTGLLPMIEAARAVLEARIGRTDALYDVQAARADLEEASGVALSAP
jgi:cobalt-zinc-cadmium efflux system outer membrane protein